MGTKRSKWTRSQRKSYQERRKRQAARVAMRLQGKRKMPLDGWEWDGKLDQWKSEVINAN
jgi:hypothetical protein